MTPDAAAALLFATLSLLYFVQAATLAARAPFWMDEILTLWTGRLPSLPAIWSALVRGAEFTPPLYDFFIHALQQLGVTSALGLRLPSIVAMYVAALATGATVRRHAGTGPAALAAGVILASGLFGYAVQMRPYALVTAAFACALMLYDRPGRPSKRRLVAIALLLALAIGLHFYALLLAAGLAALELIRGKPDWRILGAIALGACSILLWLPILLAARAYSAGDVGAPDYYAQPVFLALVQTYARLLDWLIIPLVGLLILTIRREASPMRVTALTMTALPCGIFAFALLVSHSYADRYALAGGIGIALLFASLAQQLDGRASMWLLALLIVGTPLRGTGEIGKADRLTALAAVDAARDTLPIVTGNGLRFFEIAENSHVADDLIFLVVPVPSSDPTNRNQVLRWKAIKPDLKVMDAQAFLCATPAFYLFAQPRDGGADNLPGWLTGRARFTPPAGDRASLTLVRSLPCASMDKR